MLGTTSRPDVSPLLRFGHKKTINPGRVWLDDRDVPIQAHGGGVTQLNGTYYWFGEDRTSGLNPNVRYVSCYSSTDFVNWTFLGHPFQISDPSNLGENWVLERPKVFYNEKRNKFVMYAHIDNATYDFAHIATAESDSICGSYMFLRTFRPLGNESRDIGQYIDRDGKHYLVSSGPVNRFYIYKLDDNDLDVEKIVKVFTEDFEAGALAQHNGRYYLVASDRTWWAANPNRYSTAQELQGPWTEFRNIAPPAANTYGSQSSMLLNVVGSERSSLIFMGDQWNPDDLSSSRYNWMPLEVNKANVTLPAPQDWSIDLKTGSVF